MAEALMVLAGHHHVLHAGLFSELGPIACRIRLRLELLSQLLVFRNRDALHFHGPLVAAEHAIKAPVDEHAELGLTPPLDSLLMIGRRSEIFLLGSLLCAPAAQHGH